MAEGGPLERQDLVSDDALKAPGILTEEFQKLLEKLDDVVKKSQEYGNAFSTSETSTTKMKESTSGLTEENKLLASTMDKINTELLKQSDEYLALNKTLTDAKQLTKEKTQLGDREAESVNRQNASIRELGAALNANRAAYSNLRNEQERSSDKGRELLKVIQEQDKQFKELQNTVGKNQEKVGDYKGELEGLMGRFGEVGEKGSEVWKMIGEAAESGWAVVAGAIALGTFALKQWIEKTDEGKIQYEIFTLEIETAWDRFTNKIAIATSASVKFFTGQLEYQKALKDIEEQRKVAQMSKSELEDYEKKKEREEQINYLVEQREELQKEENERMVERLEVLDQAAKLELEARTATEGSSKALEVRYEAIVKAGELYNEVQQKDVEIATKKAGLANTEIMLHAEGRDLTVEEHTLIEKNIAAVVQLQLEYDRGQKRRKTLEGTLHLEILRQIEEEKKARESYQYGLYDKDVEAVEKMAFDKAKVEEDARNKEEKKWDDYFAALDKQYDESVGKDLLRMYKEEDAAKESARRRLEIETRLMKELNALKAELARSSVDFLKGLAESSISGEEEDLQRSLEVSREKYDAELALAGDNAEAKKRVEENYKRDQERINKELAQVKRKAAEFDKAASILDISIRTVQAVAYSKLEAAKLASNPLTVPLVPLALAQIPIEIGIGAAQIAAVLAKPLPSYKYGTQYHKGGPAIIGDGGIPELFTTPQGIAGLSPSHSTLVDLPEGSKVFTGNMTTRLLAMMGVGVPERLDRVKQLDNSIVKELQKTNQLLSRPQSHTSIESDGTALIITYKTAEAQIKRIRKNVMVG